MDSGTDAFLRTLMNIWEHLFYRIPQVECLLKFHFLLILTFKLRTAIYIYLLLSRQYMFIARVYRQHIRQPQYQQLKVEGHLRVCGNGEIRIVPLLQMSSQDTNLRRSYETRFQRKFKTNKINYYEKLTPENFTRNLQLYSSYLKPV